MLPALSLADRGLAVSARWPCSLFNRTPLVACLIIRDICEANLQVQRVAETGVKGTVTVILGPASRWGWSVG
eukprot:2559816-Amphidinium_carterae.1